MTDTAPLVPGEQILAEIAAVAAGAVTTADYIAAVDGYFAPGGGFDTSAYKGGAAVSEQRVGPSTAVDGLPTAVDDALREGLRSAALAALAGDSSLPLTATDRQILVETAGEDLFAANSGIVGLQASVGYTQQRIEEAQSALAARGDGARPGPRQPQDGRPLRNRGRA